MYTLKSTLAPETGFPFASVTVTTAFAVGASVNVKYGVLNTIDDANGEWNDVQETVVNYNEDVNKLGVVVQGHHFKISRI